MRITILLILFIKTINRYVLTMNNDQQFLAINFEINSLQYEQNTYFAYGIWTKYLPLITNSQMGEIGIFNSNCFNIHNALDLTNNQINFLYYDCITQNIITKNIQFITDEEIFYQYQIIIENDKYEYQWFYFELYQWPKQRRLELTIVSTQTLSLHEILDVQYPYLSKNLQLRFGGDLKKNDNLLPNDQQLFSYLPSKMFYYPFKIDQMNFQEDPLAEIISAFEYQYGCQCQSDFSQFIFLELTQQQTFIQTSFNEYCDQYSLNGWIKVIDYHQQSESFTYLLLKMCSNNENTIIQNQNLCAFQLFFSISNDIKKIIVTTYSYLIPLVNQDYSQNQNLITQEYEIIDISKWYYLQVVFIQNYITIQIIYYDNNELFQQELSRQVNHFHNLQFKFVYGNVNQLTNDYLQIKLHNIIYNNCFGFLNANHCDKTCLTCDGPTEYNCLSCDINTNRIYQKNIKACICPYGYINNFICSNYQNFNFEIIQSNQEYIKKCKFGYFEIDDNCIQCPSVLKTHLMTCLQCLQNPQKWINNPICGSYIALDQIGSPFEIVVEGDTYYAFDGEILTLSENFNSLNQTVSLYDNFKLRNVYFREFCQYSDLGSNTILYQYLKCYGCSAIRGCIKCKVTSYGLYCLLCQQNTVLQNGECIDENLIGNFNINQCQPPYYKNSKYGCSLCQIKNCIYCFEYLEDDLTFCTLYRDFNIFQINVNHKVGCALCESQYIFDFTKGECIQATPQLENCARSFINLNGQEVCTLSTIIDFSIAPEVQQCQQYISQCKQCILTPYYYIKCIVCEDGYSASIISGQCEICQQSNAKICIEGSFIDMDGWVQLIQSFMMQFLPNQYFYPHTSIYYYIVQLAITCNDGYVVNNKGQCVADCDTNCQKCDQFGPNFYQSQCQYCGVDNYDQPKRSSLNGVCFTCTQLCEICVPRDENEIKQLNPQFIYTQENLLYTYKCLKTVDSIDETKNKIQNNPYFQIANYCFDELCINFFNFNVEIICYNFYLVMQESLGSYYQDQINIFYCNQMGIQKLAITFVFDSLSWNCWYGYPTEIRNNLKQLIFTLQEVYFKAIGMQNSQSLIYDSLIIINFDHLEFQNLYFVSPNDCFYLKFTNHQNNILTLQLQNITFTSYQVQNYYKISSSSLFIQNFKLSNITLKDQIIQDTSIFDINAQNIELITIKIENCTFYNATIFNLINSTSTLIKTVIIQDSIFNNSSLFTISRNKLAANILLVDSLNIINNFFHNSSIFLNIEQFITKMPDIQISNLYVDKNQFSNSQLFQTNKNFSIIHSLIQSNKFENSQFYITSNEFVVDNLTLKFLNFTIEKNDFITSSLISAVSDHIQVLEIKNFYFNETKSSIYQQEYLFIIKCLMLFVDEFQMFENFNIQVFYLYQIFNAQLNQINIQNSKPIFQIQVTYNCYPMTFYRPIILHISNFTNLQMNNIIISKQLSFDQSLIQIKSETAFNSINNEIIQIQNFSSIECIILKKNIGNIFSLLAIFSEKNQLILLKNLTFIKNTFHQYIDDPSSASAGLVYIASLQSEVIIDQIYSEKNHLTNSTNSFITILSQIVQIKNINIINHNYNFDLSWRNIYYFKYGSLLVDEVYNLIKSIFIIQNIGGAFSITATNLTVKNGQFTNITAQSSAVLELKTQGIGQVLINSLYFNNIQSDLSQFVDLNGCINIYSKNSLLNLQLIDVKFNFVLNNVGSAILSIIPSQKKNFILLSNIQIGNCFSLINTLTKIEFPENKQIINFVQLENVTIKSTLVGQINFFHQLNTIAIDDVNKIKIDSGFINLKNCDFNVKNIFVEGVFILPIMKLEDISNLFIQQFQIISVQQFYPFNLLQIHQQKSTIKQTIISNFKMQNLKLISVVDEIPQVEQRIFFSTFECKIDYTLSYQNNSQGLMNQFVQQFVQDSISAIPFFYFYTNSEQIKILLSNVDILQNSFLNSQYYGMQLQLDNFKQLKLTEFKCIQNNFYENGCIIFESSDIQKQKSKILIDKSMFVSNEGGMGVGIFSNYHNLILKNCKFLKNNSTDKGGAVYFNSYKQIIKLINTFIFNNSAQIGGGIYLNGNNHFDDENFKKSMIKFNKAVLNAGNLNEQPRFLQLSINNINMISESINKNNSFAQQFQIQTYKILEQGKVVYTNFLLFPSNQQVLHYQIFSQKTNQFVSYIDEIQLSFRNTFGELIFVKNNDFCSIQQYIISNNEIDRVVFFESIFFNSTTDKFNLGTYKIKFDPYFSQGKISQLQITCPTDNNTNDLIYILNTKSFMCQLGEFYVDEGCEVCSAIQGFYSVTYNVTKCSIFDKLKFKSITSNRIELLEGYWRPNPLSDYVEECFKNKEFCHGGWETNNQLCTLGHIGGLCEECDIYNVQGNGQFFKSQQDLNCKYCFQFDTGVLYFLLALIWSLLSIILTLRSVEKSNNLYASLRLRQKQYKILFQLNQDHESILIKMLINYVWIFSVILTFNIDFRISLNIADSTSNTAQFMTNNLNCYLSDISSITIIYFKVIFMIVLIILQLIFIISCYYLISKIKKIKFELSVVSTTAIYLFVSSHASIIKNLCSLISRRKISEIYYIQGDVSYLFDTNTHYKWIFGFIIPGLGVYGLSIPILLFFSIYIQRKNLDQIKRRKYLCYLFNEYNQSSYFWEQIKIWQKTIIIIILTQFETDILLKVSLLGISLLLYQILALKFKPYNIQNLNKMDVESGQICTFAVFIAAIAYGSEKYNTQYSLILQAFLMLLLIRLCVPFIHSAFRVYYKKYKVQIISQIISILKKLKISSTMIYILSKKLNSWKQKQVLLKSNIAKLRLHLESISKISEQQRIPSLLSTPGSTLRSRQNSRACESKKIIKDDD